MDIFIFYLILILGIIFQKIEEFIKHNKKQKTIYKSKRLMTQSEYNFYNKIKGIESNYKIVPQLNLASVVFKENNNKYYTDLFRNIDFTIFSHDYQELLLLIELNDSTHNQSKRKKRDYKVQSICNDIKVPLLKFYTNYPNK